jgi:hypothetical protein
MATDESPIRYQGRRIIFDTRTMKVGQPYPFLYREAPALAILRADGSMDVYGYPDSEFGAALEQAIPT